MTKIISILSILFLMTVANANDMKYEKIGQWNIALDNPTQMVDKSRIMTLFTGGTIALADGGGIIKACIEDGHLYARSIDVNIRCYVELDDNSTMLLEYVAKLVPDETFWDLFPKGVLTTPPNIGLKYWTGEFKMATVSEKYAWVNDNVIVGIGLELQGMKDGKAGYALYDLYALKH